MISMVNLNTQNEKAEATKKIVESIRDLCSLKITLPLGNPNLKLVHTNQFLFTELPTEFFELANMDVISKALNSTYSRYSGYEVNRWYIEGVTITNNGKDAKMELDLNPFASNLIKYKDDKNSFIQAYSDAFNKETTNTSSKNVKSVSSGYKLKNVSGFSKSDQAFIKEIVTKAFKAAGNPTKALAQAKAIHEFYKKHHVYSGYECMKYMRSLGFKKTWNKSAHNCGDGAATLQAMYRCAGFTCDIMNGHYHFWVRVKVNGKWYYCDQAGKGGAHNTRVLGAGGTNNNVWDGISGGSVKNNYC